MEKPASLDRRSIDENLCCSICSELITDPRVLTCGHSFCYDCIKKWRQKSRVCPNCRGEMGDKSPPRNNMLVGLLDAILEKQGHMTVCTKCEHEKSTCTICSHCKQVMCPDCVEKHVKELQSDLQRSNRGVARRIKKLETQLEKLTTAQNAWTNVLGELSSRADRLNALLQSRADTIRKASEALQELNETAATAAAAADAATLDQGIEAANRLNSILQGVERGRQSWHEEDHERQSTVIPRNSREMAEQLAECFALVEQALNEGFASVRQSPVRQSELDANEGAGATAASDAI